MHEVDDDEVIRQEGLAKQIASLKTKITHGDSAEEAARRAKLSSLEATYKRLVGMSSEARRNLGKATLERE